VDHLVNLIESMGVLVLFLPPYSPDMMPIESAFSKVKSFLKANEIAFGAYDDPTAEADTGGGHGGPVPPPLVLNKKKSSRYNL